MKRMYLASEMKNKENMVHWGEFLGGFTNKRCVCIPTSMNGDFMTGPQYGLWKGGATDRALQDTNMEVEYMILEEVGEGYDAEIVLSQADTIFVMGGSTGYLMYWMLRRNLDIILPKMVDKGIVYAGSSSGSMVCSPTLDVSEWYTGEPERGAHYLPGLNIVPFDIFPHYDEKNLPTIKEHFKGDTLYLLKNEEAVIVEGEEVKVVGEERRLTINIRS